MLSSLAPVLSPGLWISTSIKTSLEMPRRRYLNGKVRCLGGFLLFYIVSAAFSLYLSSNICSRTTWKLVPGFPRSVSLPTHDVMVPGSCFCPVKNFETKCKGLSFALFIFSIAGNTTYCLSILAASLEPAHIAANASWLAGENRDPYMFHSILTLRSPGTSRKRTDCVLGYLCECPVVHIGTRAEH